MLMSRKVKWQCNLIISLLIVCFILECTIVLWGVEQKVWGAKNIISMKIKQNTHFYISQRLNETQMDLYYTTEWTDWIFSNKIINKETNK